MLMYYFFYYLIFSSTLDLALSTMLNLSSNHVDWPDFGSHKTLLTQNGLV